MSELFDTATHQLSLFEDPTGDWKLRVTDSLGTSVQDFALEGMASNAGVSLTVVTMNGTDSFQIQENQALPSQHTQFNFRKVNAHLLTFGVQANAELAGVGVADLRECGSVNKDIFQYTFWLGPAVNVAPEVKVKYLRVDTLSVMTDKGLSVYATCDIDQCVPMRDACVDIGFPTRNRL